MTYSEVDTRIQITKRLLSNATTKFERAKYQEELSSLIEYQKFLLENEVKVKVLTREQAYQNRMEGYSSEWHEWARKLYTIETLEDKTLKVRSNALNWQVDMSWTFPSEIDALEKIEQLVNWKMADRDRGFGSIEQDLAKA